MMAGSIAVGAGGVLGLGVYLFFSYCLLLICRKTQYEPGLFVWLPVLQVYSMLKAARLHGAWMLLFLVPLANIILLVVTWVRVCENAGHSPWLVLLMFVPLANIIFLVYLAFSESNPRVIR